MFEELTIVKTRSFDSAKRETLKKLGKTAGLLAILSVNPFLYSCTPHRPQLPIYSGALPDNYLKVAQNVPHLEEETRLLPEVRDGISIEDANTLNTIAELYENNPVQFKRIFKEMYNTGIPDKRSYCSPLQAVFWAVEDGKTDLLRPTIDQFRPTPDKWSLENLMLLSWDFDSAKKEQSLNLSESDLKYFMSKLSSEERAVYKGVSPGRIRRALHIRYMRDASRFPEECKSLIEKSMGPNKDYLRWKDFYPTVERLSSPETAQIWLNANIRDTPDVSHYTQSPQQTFTRKKGDCEDFAVFGVFCVDFNGMEARVVTNDKGSLEGHAVGSAFYKGTYVKFADTTTRKVIRGYESYDDVGKSILDTGGVKYMTWRKGVNTNMKGRF